MGRPRKLSNMLSEFNEFFIALQDSKDDEGNDVHKSLQQISQATKISKPYISSMRTNPIVCPSGDKIKKLATFFQVSPDEFYLALGVLPPREQTEAVKARKVVDKVTFLQTMKEMQNAG